MDDTLEEKIKRIALGLGIKEDAFKMWKSRKQIPYKHRYSIVEKSIELRTPLTMDDMQNPFKG